MNVELSLSLINETEMNDTNVKIHGPLIEKLNKLSIVLANTLYRLAADNQEPNVTISLDKSKVRFNLSSLIFSVLSIEKLFRKKSNRYRSVDLVLCSI